MNGGREAQFQAEVIIYLVFSKRSYRGDRKSDEGRAQQACPRDQVLGVQTGALTSGYAQLTSRRWIAQ